MGNIEQEKAGPMSEDDLRIHASQAAISKKLQHFIRRRVELLGEGEKQQQFKMSPTPHTEYIILAGVENIGARGALFLF